MLQNRRRAAEPSNSHQNRCIAQQFASETKVPIFQQQWALGQGMGAHCKGGTSSGGVGREHRWGGPDGREPTRQLAPALWGHRVAREAEGPGLQGQGRESLRRGGNRTPRRGNRTPVRADSEDSEAEEEDGSTAVAKWRLMIATFQRRCKEEIDRKVSAPVVSVGCLVLCCLDCGIVANRSSSRWSSSWCGGRRKRRRR